MTNKKSTNNTTITEVCVENWVQNHELRRIKLKNGRNLSIGFLDETGRMDYSGQYITEEEFQTSIRWMADFVNDFGLPTVSKSVFYFTLGYEDGIYMVHGIEIHRDRIMIELKLDQD